MKSSYNAFGGRVRLYDRVINLLFQFEGECHLDTFVLLAWDLVLDHRTVKRHNEETFLTVS